MTVFHLAGDEQMVAELRKRKTNGDASWVVDVIRDTRSPTVRNAAAIALADLKVAEAKDVLVGLLLRPETKESRGTLLYALDELGANVPLAVLVDIIVEGPYEARQEALNLIAADRIVVSGDGEATRAKALLEKLLRNATEEELRETAKSALSFLE
jgi:hypothetical protein